MVPSVRNKLTNWFQFRKANSSIFEKVGIIFSVKLMMELIPELYATSEEQMTILTRLENKNDFVIE